MIGEDHRMSQPQSIVAQLVIVLNADGTLGVNGPVENKMLVYGMLEMAKDAVRDFNKNSQKKIVELPPGTTLRAVPPLGRSGG